MKKLQYYAPSSIDEAIAILRDKGPGGRLLAGGTDLVVDIYEHRADPDYIVSLRKLTDLCSIRHEAAGVHIGAATKMVDLVNDPIVQRDYTALWDGAHVVGSVQTRNMATLGGNLVTASPSADTAPGVVVLDATLTIGGPTGSREVAVKDFFLGVRQTAVGPADVLVDVFLPKPAPHSGSAYRRYTPRAWMDLAFVGVAAFLTLGNDLKTIVAARLALGAVAPTVVRAPQAEALLLGNQASEELFAEAGRIAKAECSPIDDVRASAAYRRKMVEVWTKRVLGLALEAALAV